VSEILVTQDQLFRICQKHRLKWQEPEELLRTGIVNHAIAVGDVVIRIPCDPEWAQDDAKTEAVAVPPIMASPVRTPELLVFDSELDILPTVYTIYRRVAGRSLYLLLDDPTAIDAASFHIGQELRALHQSVLSVPDPHGWLDEHGYPETVRFIQESVDNGSLDSENASWILTWHESLVERGRSILEKRVFCHGDLHESNVLVEDDQSVWIIDWGDAGWADPSMDFGYMHPSSWPAALRGYGPVDDESAWMAAIVCRALERAVGRLASGLQAPVIGNAMLTKLLRLLRFFVAAPNAWGAVAPPPFPVVKSL
jgi:aminoglycoside phosphotransferase (APT) family kinase protein